MTFLVDGTRYWLSISIVFHGAYGKPITFNFNTQNWKRSFCVDVILLLKFQFWKILFSEISLKLTIIVKIQHSKSLIKLKVFANILARLIWVLYLLYPLAFLILKRKICIEQCCVWSHRDPNKLSKYFVSKLKADICKFESRHYLDSG